MPDLNAKLCEILEVEYQAENDDTDVELIARRREKLRILSNITDDKDVLDNVDLVAMDQDELFDILDERREKVYLYGKKFSIPFGAKNVSYIGVNNPVISIDKTKYVFEYNEAGISFKNVCYENTVNHYITRGELLYIDNQFKEAFPLVKEAAENGNPRAMYILAMSYKDGLGVESNSEKCNEWLRKANGLNEPTSMMNYAYRICKDDIEKKMQILSQYSEPLKKLADLGDTLAQFEYGDFLKSYSDNKGLGFEYVSKAATKGFAPAQDLLGNYYFNCNGVEKDYVKAVEWYRKAAELGYDWAQYNLGNMYRNGNGVEKDYAKAVEWFRKAAEQGNDYAQNNLGYMYDMGYGIEQDKIKAVEWYRKAANQGNEAAKNNLKNLGV